MSKKQPTSPPGTALSRYEAARNALAAAHRVDEVKNIRDKAEAMAAYARQARDTELIQYATEIKVRAERRCGELLITSAERGERAGKGNPELQMSNGSTFATLADLGLTRDQSSRYQKLAAMPAEQFETAVETAKATAGAVSTAGLLRTAAAYQELHKTKALLKQLNDEMPPATRSEADWRDTRTYLLGLHREAKDRRRRQQLTAKNYAEFQQMWTEISEFLSTHFKKGHL